MPHCILEYSDNLPDNIDFQEVLKEIHQALEVTGLFKINDIKSRAIIHNRYYIGDGDKKRGFAALSVGIFMGRDVETRRMISQKCLEVLKPHFKKSFQELLFDITVQITELDNKSYVKMSSQGD